MSNFTGITERSINPVQPSLFQIIRENNSETELRKKVVIQREIGVDQKRFIYSYRFRILMHTGVFQR